MKLPIECTNCKKIFDMGNDLKEKDWDRKVKDVMDELYGENQALCPDCRK